MCFPVRNTVIAGLLLAAASSTAIAAGAPAMQPPAPQLPHMQLLQQFGGPFDDTIIQKLYDPQSNVICYLYIPVKVAHASEGGTAVYGANNIGSMSCVPAMVPVTPALR